MTVYLISDLHLDHANIIDYCDRPFDTLDEMNETLIDNWNRVVEPDDLVYFGGDLAMAEESTALMWADQLDGNFIFLDGNHDDITQANAPFPLLDSIEFSAAGIDFHYTHWEKDIADTLCEWGIHGHHHNNDLHTYPFINYEENRVNVSAEVIGYTPLPVDTLCDFLRHGETYQTIHDAPAVTHLE